MILWKSQELRISRGTMKLTYETEMKLTSEAAKVLTDTFRGPYSANDYIKKDEAAIATLNRR